MAPKKVLLKGIRTAFLVGTLLTIINQWDALFGESNLRLIPLILTYLVPFSVFVYSYHANKHNDH